MYMVFTCYTSLIHVHGFYFSEIVLYFIFSNLLVSTTLKLILFFFQAAFFVSLDDEPQNYDKVSTLASTSTVHELFLKNFV